MYFCRRFSFDSLMWIYKIVNPRLTKYFSDMRYGEQKKQLDELVGQYVDSVVRGSRIRIPNETVRKIKSAYSDKLHKELSAKVKRDVAQQVKELGPFFISYAVYGACQQLNMKYDDVVNWAREQGITYVKKISEKDFEIIASVLNAVRITQI